MTNLVRTRLAAAAAALACSALSPALVPALSPVLGTALGTVPAAELHAQQPEVRRDGVFFAARGRGMLGIMTEAIRRDDGPSRTRLIREVVPESPAQRAGLQPGDTILRINNLAASEQVMGAPFEPGDTVVLRIRRNGSERDVTVVAAQRTGQFGATSFVFRGDSARIVMTDSVLRQVNVIMRNVRQQVDSLQAFPLSIERTAGDSTIVMRFGNDSVRVFSYRGAEALRMLPDSMMTRFTTVGPLSAEWPGDSARFRVFTSGNLSIFGDSTFRPSDLMASNIFIGMRSIAGAEVTDLNEGLAQYFGVTDGVLVTNARQGTPAERAGIQAGDVIVQVDGHSISAVADLRRALAATGTGRAIPVRVVRRGQTIDLSIGG
jgi:membrane-associated protease RseP (regulator of RpoE activity)